ncbi:pyrimidine 5'-nucleotidase [Flavimaricola marinus]|uniref:Phosphoglycolate phosphatase n=1 Tax=Flavimaricola marinus TaxID=1819565 RepID=A0A238LIH8_9RHOB|nr:pyrimidine 5'-nucleotidase [Flavimaricola marinus]SMY09205.1 Phosphoglycolate phosphatase [Flavimaricola marinus]
MIAESFSHVQTWVFDLDNTLYPPSDRLFDQIEVRMTEFVSSALGVDKAHADHLRTHYWETYGTTLAGLMTEHDVDPTPYLTHVHDIDLSHMTPDLELAAHIRALPGRRIVYTNGCEPYAQRVLEARGLHGVFDAVYGVEHANFLPKPDRAAFETVFAKDGVSPDVAAMFEDDPRNLMAPHAMGMRTVHVSAAPAPHDHIHHHTDDLTAFLSQLV